MRVLFPLLQLKFFHGRTRIDSIAKSGVSHTNLRVIVCKFLNFPYNVSDLLLLLRAVREEVIFSLPLAGAVARLR